MSEYDFDGPPVKVGDYIKVLKMWTSKEKVGEIHKVIEVVTNEDSRNGLPSTFPIVESKDGSTHVVAWESAYAPGVRPPNDIDEVTDKFFPTEEEKIARYLSDRYGDISNVKQASPNEPPVGYATLGTIENVEEAFDSVKVYPDNSPDVIWMTDVKEQSHYTSLAIQPIEYITANGLSFLEGNILKYISRFKNKNGLEDLWKARDYLDRLIEDVSNHPGRYNL